MKSREIPMTKSLVWRWFLSQWEITQWLEEIPMEIPWKSLLKVKYPMEISGKFPVTGNLEIPSGKSLVWRWNIAGNPSGVGNSQWEIWKVPRNPTSRCTLVATNLATCSGASPRSNAPSTSASRWDSGKKTWEKTGWFHQEMVISWNLDGISPREMMISWDLNGISPREMVISWDLPKVGLEIQLSCQEKSANSRISSRNNWEMSDLEQTHLHNQLMIQWWGPLSLELLNPPSKKSSLLGSPRNPRGQQKNTS